MRNWKRLMVLVVFTTALGVASFAAEDEVNAQTAGSAGTPPSPPPNTGGTSSAGTTGTTPDTSTAPEGEKKASSGGCTVAAPSSEPGMAALLGLGLGLAFWRRRKSS